jgi:hypothetical protein
MHNAPGRVDAPRDNTMAGKKLAALLPAMRAIRWLIGGPGWPACHLEPVTTSGTSRGRRPTPPPNTSPPPPLRGTCRQCSSPAACLACNVCSPFTYEHITRSTAATSTAPAVRLGSSNRGQAATAGCSTPAVRLAAPLVRPQDQLGMSTAGTALLPFCHFILTAGLLSSREGHHRQEGALHRHGL